MNICDNKVIGTNISHKKKNIFIEIQFVASCFSFHPIISSLLDILFPNTDVIDAWQFGKKILSLRQISIAFAAVEQFAELSKHLNFPPIPFFHATLCKFL